MVTMFVVDVIPGISPNFSYHSCVNILCDGYSTGISAR